MISSSDIADFPIMNGLTEQELALLAQHTQVKEFAAGETIFEEGVHGGELCLIKEGEVKISRFMRLGDSQTLGVLKAGMSFGGISFIDNKAHSASVIAVTDVKTIHIRREYFEQLAQSNVVCAAKLLHSITLQICAFLRQMNQKFIDIAQYVS